MAKLLGTQKLVLQMILDVSNNPTEYVTDFQIEQGSRIALVDVRDSIEILARDEFVDVVRTQDGFSVAITASGRQVLNQFRPFPATPSDADHAGNSQRSERSTRGTDQVNKISSGDFKVDLTARSSWSPPRPWGTAEPLHFTVDAKLVNLGVVPLFIVEARLRSKMGQHRLDFKKLCDEERPTPCRSQAV